MRVKYKKLWSVKVLLALVILIILLIGGLLPSACTGVTTVPKGWAGGAVADNTLYIASMEGKLVAVNISDGSYLSVPVASETKPPSGGLGCAPASKVVAIYGTPAIDKDLIYVGGYDGKIYAFARDKLSSEPIWVYPSQGFLGPIVGSLITAQDKIYFGSANGKVYALEAARPIKNWEFSTEDKIWSTPAIDDGILFIGSFDNRLYALRTSDGSKKWEFETKGAIVATPLVANNTVYIGSFDRYFYAINAATGALKWKFMAENWFWVKPIIYNDVVYTASLDGRVYALKAEGGEKLAEFDLGSPVSSSPVLVSNLVVFITQDGVVYILDTETNQLKRLVSLEETVYAPLAASQGQVYIHTAKDSLYAVDVKSGAIRQFSIKGK